MSYHVGEKLQSGQPCKICGEHELEIVATRGRGGQHLTTGICTGCGLVHSYPIPTKEELDHYYSQNYRNDYKGVFTPQRKHILRYSRVALERLARLGQFAPKGLRLLDVGSGSGEFSISPRGQVLKLRDWSRIPAILTTRAAPSVCRLPPRCWSRRKLARKPSMSSRCTMCLNICSFR
jgi:hypothetical protein